MARIRLTEEQREDLWEQAERPATTWREEEQKVLARMKLSIADHVDRKPEAERQVAINVAKSLTKDGLMADYNTKLMWVLYLTEAAGDQFSWDVTMAIVEELRRTGVEHDCLGHPRVLPLVLDLLPLSRPSRRTGHPSFAARDSYICSAIQCIKDIGHRDYTSKIKRSACHLVEEALPDVGHPIGYNRVKQIWKHHRRRIIRLEGAGFGDDVSYDPSDTHFGPEDVDAALRELEEDVRLEPEP